MFSNMAVTAKLHIGYALFLLPVGFLAVQFGFDKEASVSFA
jgi:hypothetical protein